jgi:predicted nuclease of predicted toxin-antitoxin system
MRFLADENFPGDAVSVLKNHGHDVLWIRKENPGSTDHNVLSVAQSEDRVLLTFDKDFGELAFRAKLSASCGVILFRIPMVSPSEASLWISSVLESRSDWSGYFSVVEEDRIRMTPLPVQK